MSISGIGTGKFALISTQGWKKGFVSLRKSEKGENDRGYFGNWKQL